MLEYAKVLPTLRPDHFEEAFNKMRNLLRENHNDKVAKFYDYLERFWYLLREVVSVWNVPFNTNNICERYHQEINKNCNQGKHPRVWQMTGKIYFSNTIIFFYFFLSL